MRRKIITPAAAPADPRRQRQLAAYKAHLTRSQLALKRWTRRLKRAMTEVARHNKAVERYTARLNKEANP
jgi:hypothetical protein